MRILLLLLALMVFSREVLPQTIPYNLYPDWESTPQGHVATGLGVADINGDGWKDIIAANGNDIDRQHLVVYYNQGDGTFPLVPDWQSFDVDYHGHLAVGDINRDGWLDVAVSVYLGQYGWGSKGKVKVYYNTGGELETTPSFQSNPFYTFSCSLGDADADGDLDLAVACSETYHSKYDYGRIFFNENGLFSIDNVWLSDIVMGPMDVEFGDLDGNGFMDVIFVSETTPSYIFLADTNGQISSSPVWQSAEGNTYLNSVDIGHTFPYNIPYAVMTGNNQTSGDGRIRQYLFGQPFPETSYAYWLSDLVGYGSGILIADVTRDQIPDLIYGGWWLPVEVLVGDGTSFNTTPAYTSSMTSVVETIQMADLGKETLVSDQDEYVISFRQNVLYLSHQVIDQINEVRKNGVTMEDTDFIYVPNKNWISFAHPLFAGDQVTVDYLYCLDGDLIITNWDSDKGNFIYYNNASPVAIDEPFQRPGSPEIGLFPQPVADLLNVTVRLSRKSECRFGIYSTEGKKMKAAGQYDLPEGPSKLTIDVSALPVGVYFLKIDLDNEQFLRKFVKF
ncbi:MAG: FG-GAP-like repeat-containing protein [Bacteroidales bacterium]|nr:FG-GAP-like repeat-containing protein [Bacteroidales bacterium]